MKFMKFMKYAQIKLIKKQKENFVEDTALDIFANLFIRFACLADLIRAARSQKMQKIQNLK